MIVVQKFGGTCLATAANRELACDRVKDAMQAGFNVCAVVSAMEIGRASCRERV